VLPLSHVGRDKNKNTSVSYRGTFYPLITMWHYYQQ
jgi:hypothetical protein